MNKFELCLNCNHTVTSRYCGHCGQRRSIKRIDFASLIGEVIESGPHYTNRYAKTFKGILYAPGKTIALYLAGRRTTYQGPASYFLCGYIFFSVFSYFAVRAGIETGSFGGFDKWWFLVGTLVPVAIAYLFVTREKFTFPETLVCILYLYGTAFPLLVLSTALQFAFPSPFELVPLRFRFLVVDVPLQLIVVAISFNFVKQSELSVRWFAVAMLLETLYLIAFRHFAVSKLPL